MKPLYAAALALFLSPCAYGQETSSGFRFEDRTLKTVTPSYSFMMAGAKITVRPNGTVELAEGLSLDEASKLFWKTIQDMGMKLACEQKKD